MISLVNYLECEVCWIAAGFLVVKTVDSHILFSDFSRSIVEWVLGVDFGGYYNFHIGSKDSAVYSFDSFRSDFEYFAHDLDVFGG